MKQAEQQHIRRAVGVEVVNDGIDPLDRGVNPGVDLTQKIDPVGGGPPVVRMRQGRAAGRLESTEDVSGDTTPAVIDLLLGPFSLGRGRFHELPARKAPGRLWTHFVQANHDAARRRRGVELLDDPLFLAKSGSTRAPNRGSRCDPPSWRHFRSSRRKISLIRLRRIAMPCSDR
jgi:hypothetical protein